MKVLRPLWKYRIIQCDNSNSVVTTITETINGIPTSGGSSFNILVESDNTKEFCPVHDVFNGTYIARCELHEAQRTRIITKGHFTNFTAYWRTVAPKTTVLFNISCDTQYGIIFNV